MSPSFLRCPRPTIHAPNSHTLRDICPRNAGIEADQIKITEQVKFKLNSATILKDSDGLLDSIAKLFAEHPEIQRVRIEGHTDNLGSPQANKGLSDRRAKAVVVALTRRKIDTRRLVGVGYGQERPIDSNDSEKGRANNRRVEFHIEDIRK